MNLIGGIILGVGVGIMLTNDLVGPAIAIFGLYFYLVIEFSNIRRNGGTR